jgi:hypothetical protein
LASDPDWAVDGQRAAISERHHRLAGKDLFVIGDLVHIGDDAKDQARLVENAPPLELILGREDPVEDLDQLARMRLARGVGSKARIIEHARCQTFLYLFPAPFVGGDRQQQPAPIAAAVMDPERVEPALARRLRHHLFAAERRLHRTAIGPQPVGQQ